jgi:hypothetical protein
MDEPTEQRQDISTERPENLGGGGSRSQATSRSLQYDLGESSGSTRDGGSNSAAGTGTNTNAFLIGGIVILVLAIIFAKLFNKIKK